MTALPDEPVYVIALATRVPWWRYHGQRANQLLVDRVLGRVRLPGYILVFTIAGSLTSLGKKIARVPEALVFARS